MEFLLALDQQLFLLLNHLPHTSFLDNLAQFFSGLGNAGLVWFAMGLWLIAKEEKRSHWLFMRLLTTGGMAWITQLVLKELFRRPRPGVDIGAISVGVELADFAFPSGHAMMAWAMATILAAKEPRWRWVFFALATLISFSRIYLGKHYPLDVLAGGLIGWGIGIIGIWLNSTRGNFAQPPRIRKSPSRLKKIR